MFRCFGYYCATTLIQISVCGIIKAWRRFGKESKLHLPLSIAFQQPPDSGPQVRYLGTATLTHGLRRQVCTNLKLDVVIQPDLAQPDSKPKLDTTPMKGCVSAADAVDSKVPSRLQLQPSTDCRHAGAIRSRCVSVDRDVVLPREVRRGQKKCRELIKGKEASGLWGYQRVEHLALRISVHTLNTNWMKRLHQCSLTKELMLTRVASLKPFTRMPLGHTSLFP